jgi:adenosine/AMP kinase
MEMITVKVEKPDEINFIFGQSHFIKTVEDLHEALVGAVPGIEFGLAFCEASGPALIRSSGTSDDMIELAVRNAGAIAAGRGLPHLLRNGESGGGDLGRDEARTGSVGCGGWHKPSRR